MLIQKMEAHKFYQLPQILDGYDDMCAPSDPNQSSQTSFKLSAMALNK